MCLTSVNSGNCNYTLCKNISITGVANLTGDDYLSVYPVPFENELLINTAKGNIKSVAVFDVLGRMVLQKTMVASSAQPEKLDASHLAPGTYLIKIRTETSEVIRSIFKM